MTKNLRQAQLYYLFDKRAKLIRELDNYMEAEFPWSLHTQIEMLNERIADIQNEQNRRNYES